MLLAKQHVVRLQEQSDVLLKAGRPIRDWIRVGIHDSSHAVKLYSLLLQQMLIVEPQFLGGCTLFPHQSVRLLRSQLLVQEQVVSPGSVSFRVFLLVGDLVDV